MRHFRGVPTSWGSYKHYNTSITLTYHNKIEEHINIQLQQLSKGTHSQDKTQKSNNKTQSLSANRSKPNTKT